MESICKYTLHSFSNNLNMNNQDTPDWFDEMVNSVSPMYAKVENLSTEALELIQQSAPSKVKYTKAASNPDLSKVSRFQIILNETREVISQGNLTERFRSTETEEDTQDQSDFDGTVQKILRDFVHRQSICSNYFK